MEDGTFLFDKDTGNSLVLIGYTDEEIAEYVRGRKEVGTGNFSTVKVKCFRNPNAK